MKTSGHTNRSASLRQQCSSLFVRGSVLLALVVTLGCNRSHDAAKKVERVEPQLTLPQTTPEQRKLQDIRLDWCMQNFVDAYDDVGKRDKKWDGYARDALTYWAQATAYGNNIKGYPNLMIAKLTRAVELGCDDPLVKFVYLDFVEKMDGWTEQQVAQAYGRAADDLRSSKYPPGAVYDACASAARCYNKRRPYPEAGRTYVDGATKAAQDIVSHSDTPILEVYATVHDLLTLIERWDDKKTRFEPIEASLQKNWPSSGVSYVLRAEFMVDYAWDGRTRQAASKVTPDQWQAFRERLADAEGIIAKGMSVAPTEGRLPALMIPVVSGQQKGIEDMRAWWEKAMVADPNNFNACEKLLHFLLPRWYGSRDEMIAFGRECVASEKFGGTVPLALAEAHWVYNQYDGAPDGSYWKQPDVWPDIKVSYEKFFSLNPNATHWHHNYARYAYWCEQWDVLKQELKIMGDDVNYNYFGGRKAFDQMVSEAEAHTTTPKHDI